MKIQTKLTISRIQGHDPEKKEIRICVQDETSRIRFLEISISPESLMESLVGLSQVSCEAQVFGLENIGKRKESLPYTIPVSSYHKAKVTEELDKAVIPEGWTLDKYIGSQNSIVRRSQIDENDPLQYNANVSIYRYVKEENNGKND